ncbi:MAG: tetratricopeptide repeat protein [Alphaproteobacteria bacterium]|jgi:tetratricopeptide (TPR) repeat protein
MREAPRTAQQQFAEALALLQAQQFAAADAAFQALLKRQPRSFDVLHLGGIAAVQAGRPEEGVTLIRRALAINPRHADAYSNHGSALIRLGRYDEALSSLDRGLALNPKAANLHHNRGVALKRLKRFENAVLAFDRVLAVQPDHVEAHNERAGALMDHGKLADALAGYERALSLRPDSAGFMVNVAMVLCLLGRHAEVLPLTERALRIKPDDIGARIARTEALLSLGQPVEGLATIDAALKINPGLADGYLWRSKALVLLGEPEAALAAVEPARQLAPQDASAHRGYGFALGHLNRVEEALAAYDIALTLKPDDTESLWNRALALLVLGRFEEGWLAYECRNLRGRNVTARKYPEPLWAGKQRIKDQRLYIYWEQGLGDTIHFARYALLAAAAGAQVTLSVQDPLLRLFKDFAPGVTVVGQNDEADGFDLHCPLLTLPLAFGTRLETIPAFAHGYLEAPAEDIARWDQRLPKGRRRIGLVWSGSQAHANDANRSLALAKLLPLFQQGDVWVSLQKEVRDRDRAALEASGILDVSAELGDFADTAALISALDLVIAVDTSVAHLAGALGKPTWVMLPFAPDFRWLLDREDSPWYPSMRLFRQSRAGDWDGVLARIGEALRQ